MLRQPFQKGTQGFDWYYFLSPDEAEIRELAQRFQLNDLYIQDILQAEHLPKVEPVGDGNDTFIIIRVLDPELQGRDFTSIPDFTRKLTLFLRENTLISVQRASFDWLDAFIQKPKNPPGNVSQLVCLLLKQGFRSFEPLLTSLSSDLDFFEQKLFENHRFPPFAKSLYNLRRKSTLIKRLFSLSGELVEFLEEKEKDEPLARDAVDMFQRLSTQVDDIHERAAALINMNLSINSQRSNEVMRFLTIYSAFFMPLTFLVGVYGMNFSMMPELSWRWGYYACWGLMLGLAGFHFWWFRRKRWL